MRFAYIDSNGNEVPIPSVDALALRIELGAINDTTELYDAQADQWGPAHTHEIFHTLSRANQGGEGFVAPPPPVPRPSGDAGAGEPEPRAPAKPAAEAAPEPERKSPAPPSEPEDAIAGLTLAEAPPELEEDEGLGLGSADKAASVPDRTPSASKADLGDGPSFDFGDVSGGLEIDGGDDTGPAMDFGGGRSPFGDQLEQDMEFSSASFDDVGGGTSGLDLEQPMSEFQADSPPAWMGPGSDDGDVMDFSSASSDAPAVEEDPLISPQARRSPKDKPSPPKFKRQRNLVGPIVGIVILAAGGVGASMAWPIVMARWEAGRDQPVREVVLPAIPERLESAYRAATDVAFATTVRESRASVEGRVASPPREFLGGIYFANASAYPGVEAFWHSVGDQLAAVRSVDTDAFATAFEAGMASAGIPADDRPRMLERATLGYDHAADARAQTFAHVEEIVDAALELHAFLLANEESIDYTPAAAITSDPVLEAKPATPRIGDALEERIDRVTSGLADLDYLDLVTAEGLWAAVLRRLQEVGIH